MSVGYTIYCVYASQAFNNSNHLSQSSFVKTCTDWGHTKTIKTQFWSLLTAHSHCYDAGRGYFSWQQLQLNLDRTLRPAYTPDRAAQDQSVLVDLEDHVPSIHFLVSKQGVKSSDPLVWKFRFSNFIFNIFRKVK